MTPKSTYKRMKLIFWKNTTNIIGAKNTMVVIDIQKNANNNITIKIKIDKIIQNKFSIDCIKFFILIIPR